MLKIVQRPAFTVTVMVNTLHTQGEFKMDCVALPQSELDAIDKKAIAEGRSYGVLREAVTKLRELELPGNPLPNVAQALDYPGLGAAMLQAYYRGLYEEQQGNSAPPPAGS